MKSFLYTIFSRTFLILVGIVFSALLGEAAIRFAISLNLMKYPMGDSQEYVHQYSSQFDLVYELKPNAYGFDGRTQVKTNSLGMKDKEYPREKSSDTLRIAVIGDSVTFGTEINTENLYSEVLEEQLNQASEGKYEVMNFGVIGYNSEQEAIVLRDKVLPLKPDVILLAYCLNDESNTDGLGALARQMHPKAFGSKLNSKLVSFILHRWERITHRHFLDSSKAKKLFGSLQQVAKNGIPVAVIVFPFRFSSVDTYKELPDQLAVSKLAKEFGLTVLDFFDVTKELSEAERSSLYGSADNVHFSPLGMSKIGNWLYENRGSWLPSKNPS